ncbi:hypothetical protein D3C71_1448390 [compost metagenome]
MKGFLGAMKPRRHGRYVKSDAIVSRSAPRCIGRLDDEAGRGVQGGAGRLRLRALSGDSPVHRWNMAMKADGVL